MKIVVTGALGHIGSRLLRELPLKFPEAEIVMVDNLRTQRYGSLFSLPKQGRYQFIEADILDADLDSLFEGVSVVVHLAAITNATESFRMREEVERVNVTGTERVARACLNQQSSLLFTSTTSVYGKSSVLRPQSPYASSKLKAEQILQKMGKEEGLRYVICRFATVFGVSPGMRFHTAVNKFCWQAVLRQPITVWRTALDQKRPYLELGDAVRVLQFIIEKNLWGGEIYDVSTTHATVRNLIDILCEFIPDVFFKYSDEEIMNQLSYEVSPQHLIAEGFQFRGDLRKGMAEIIQLLQSAHPPDKISLYETTSGDSEEGIYRSS